MVTVPVPLLPVPVASTVQRSYSKYRSIRSLNFKVMLLEKQLRVMAIQLVTFMIHALGENPMPYCNGCHPPKKMQHHQGPKALGMHGGCARSRPRPAVPQRPAPAAPNCTGRPIPVAVLLQRLVPATVQVALPKPGRRSVPCYQPQSMQISVPPNPVAAVHPRDQLQRSTY